MKKHLIALALALACLLGLVGCAGKPDETTSSEYKSFAFENVSKIVVTSIEGRKLEVTDVDTVQKITKNIASVQFEKGESSENYNGFGPFIDWYDTNGVIILKVFLLWQGKPSYMTDFFGQLWKEILIIWH